MARVTVEDCLEKEENRFALVVLAASRTRSLMKGAPQPNTAKLFTEFLLGPEHAKILIENYYDPATLGAERELVGGKKLKDIKIVPLLPSAEYAARLKSSTDQWRDLFGG